MKQVPTLRTSSTSKSAKPTHSLRKTRQQPRPLLSCGHCCPIPEGQPGVCKVRFNAQALSTSPGDTPRHAMRPSRKKPFFHAHPGALAYSFGMLAATSLLLLPEWVTSQALRDPSRSRFRNKPRPNF